MKIKKILKWVLRITICLIAFVVFVKAIDLLTLECAVRTRGTYEEWMNFWGNILGGAFTLLALVLTLNWERKKFEEERQIRERENEFKLLEADIKKAAEMFGVIEGLDVFFCNEANLVFPAANKDEVLERRNRYIKSLIHLRGCFLSKEVNQILAFFHRDVLEFFYNHGNITLDFRDIEEANRMFKEYGPTMQARARNIFYDILNLKDQILSMNSR